MAGAITLYWAVRPIHHWNNPTLEAEAVMSDTFSQADVEVVEREECFRGFYKLDRLHLRHRLFAGGMGKLINRELFVRHDAVCTCCPTIRGVTRWC